MDISDYEAYDNVDSLVKELEKYDLYKEKNDPERVAEFMKTGSDPFA